MKFRHKLAACVGAACMTTLLAILYAMRDTLHTYGPWILDSLIAVISLVILWKIAVRIYAFWIRHEENRDAKATRRVELLAREQQLAIEAERWQIERAALLIAQEHQASRIYPDAKGYMPMVKVVTEQGYEYHQLPHANAPRIAAPASQAEQGNIQPETGVPVAPAFREMSHLIRESVKLPLCYGHNGAILGTVDDLLSMAVTGKPGRGKTTALMYYVAILLACGAEVVIWDPHGAMAELAKLNDQALPNMPETARVYYFDRKEDIIASLPMLERNLQERDDYYRQTRQTVHPHLLLADELPLLADYDEELARGTRRGEEAPSLIKIIRRYVLEARKWRCYFIGSGQSMDAEILPTRVTENLSSRIVFFSSDRRARMAGLENDAIKKYLPIIRRAGSGVMVFDCARFDEPVLGAIPMISIDDLMEFLGLTVGADSDEMEPLQPRKQADSDFARDVFLANSDEKKKDAGKVLDFPKLALVEPVERLEEQSERSPKQTKEYRFTESEIIAFIAAYRMAGNIEKVLSSMHKGSGYKAHARELIAAHGLRA